MILFIFISLVLLGIATAWRLLAPEMYLRLSLPKYQFPWGRQLFKQSAVPYAQPVDYSVVAIDEPLQPADLSDSVTDQLNRMEKLLVEKNKLIDKLQKSLESERAHRSQFMKIKAMMDEEIERLKTQNKTLKPKKEQTHA